MVHPASTFFVYHLSAYLLIHHLSDQPSPTIYMHHTLIYLLSINMSICSPINHLLFIYQSTSHTFINHVSINHLYSTVRSKSVYTRRQHYEADVLYTEPGGMPNG